MVGGGVCVTEILNPVECERAITDSANEVAKSIIPVSEAYDAFRRAELDFKAAYAREFLAAHGSVEERKQIATVATKDAAEAVAVAEVRYKRLLDFQRAYRDKLSAFQTLAKSVVATYGAVKS